MPRSTIRPAVAADEHALAGLIERAYRGDSARSGWTHEADLLDDARLAPGELAAMLADPAQTLLLNEESGAPTGCVLLAARGDHAYLGMLTVDPTRQSDGLGGRLLEAAEARAADLGLPVVRMWVLAPRTELAAWYARRGYVDTGRREGFLRPPRDRYEFMVLERRL